MKSFSAMTQTSSEVRHEVCDTHGPFESRNVFGPIWSKCPECSKAEKEADERERAEKERADRRASWQRKLMTSCIPERFMNRSLESYVVDCPAQDKALSFATDFVADIAATAAMGRSALFIGKPGTGKTHLAVGIGRKFLESNRSVLFMTVLRAIRRVKDTWSRGASETETQAIDALVFPDLLILDEIGVQFGSETEKNILFDILNDRYERRKPTILMSNLPLTEVRAFLGDRVFDRMREDGGECVVFDWESHRGKKDLHEPVVIDRTVQVHPSNSIFAGAI